MKSRFLTMLAALSWAMLATPGSAADVKPLVIVAGHQQQIPAGATLVDGSGTPYGTGTGSVSSVGASSVNSTLGISGSPVTGSGVIDFSVLKWATGRTIGITGDLTYTSPSFDGSGNVTAASTLATVNSSVGTFGDATHVGAFTVNAKGLITAASSVAITGSGGTPGGSSGDIQYNNAGAFGGFTMSGDVTVVPSTGVATIGALKIATGMIQANAVTLAKIANAAASSKLLGSGASGSGSAYAELTLGTSLSFSTTTLNASGTLIGVQTITATGSGTYTPTTGTNFIVLELQGAGGGGGGSPQPGASKVGNATSGGGGAWGRVKLTANFSGASYSVGAKGTGGSAGANAGAAGGSTTFTNTAGSPTTWTAGGGTGGFAGGTGATPPTFAFAAAGGTVSGGTFDVSRPGGDSQPTVGINVGQEWVGQGGNSMYSPGASITNLFTANGQAAGFAAGGKGGGGGAAGTTGTGSAAAGGNGSDGVIIIWEYS